MGSFWCHTFSSDTCILNRTMAILNSDDESSDDENSYSSSGSDSEEGDRVIKPVFVRKENRLTIKEQESKALKEEALAGKKRQLDEERKTQTRVMVAESIRKNDEQNAAHYDDADSDAGLPDDTDDLDDEVEVS